MATNLDFKVKNGLITGGNALIGKSSATFGYRLELSSGTKTLGLHADSGTTFIYGNGDFVVGTMTANPINFYVNSGQVATISTAGNFGVGTIAPSGLMHAYSGAQTATPAAIFYSNNGAAAVGSYAGFSIWNNLSAGMVESTLVFGNTVNSFLAFGHHNGTTYSERMRISTGGDVGIGQNNPSARLHVTGGTIRHDGGNILGAAGNTNFVAMYGGSDYNLGAGMVTYGASHATLANVVQFSRGAFLESARFDASGNFGLGTASTSGGTGNTVIEGKLIVATAAGGTPAIFLPYPGIAYAGFKIEHSTSNISGAANTTSFSLRPAYTSGVATGADVDVIRFSNTSPHTFPDVLLAPDGGQVGVGVDPSGAQGQFVVRGLRTTATGQFVGGVNILDSTTGGAAGVGGVISFAGDTQGAGYKQFGAVLGGKENSTVTDVAGYLALYTRPAGGNLTERFRIDSLGNFGFGATPGTWAAADKVLDFTYPAFGMDSNGQAIVSFNLRESAAGVWTYKSTDTGQLFRSELGGGWEWLIAPSGTVATTATPVQKMMLSTLGNLGVGGSALSATRIYSSAADGTYQLGLAGTTKGLRFQSTSTDYKIEAVDPTLALTYQPLTLNGSAVNFAIAGANKVILDASGNLGINMTPVNKLDVTGSVGVVGNVAITGSTTMTGAAAGMVLAVRGAAASNSNMYLQSSAGAGTAIWLTATTGGFLQIGGSGGSEPATGAININTGNNNVGIGTASPNARLEVSIADAATNAQVTPFTLSHVTSATSVAGFGTRLQFANEDGGGTLINTNSIASVWLDPAAGVRTAAMIFYSGAANVQTEAMRIDNAGRVGVNRPTAMNTQFEVGGNIATITAAATDTSITANITAVSNLAIGCNDTAATNVFGAPAATNYLGCSIGRPTVFTTSATERMRITATGGFSFGSTGTAYGTAGQVLTSAGNAPPTWATPSAGSGSVTTVSVVSANGFAGTVATATSTPAITISTSVTGILKGNGTSVVAAVAADFPTLNQSTTGNATTATIAARSNVMSFSDGTAWQTGNTAIGTSGSRSVDLAPNTYTNCVAAEFKNSSLYSNTGTYTGLLTIAPWLGTTASTGDSSYQLSFNPAAANSTAAPVFKIRAGIDTTWGAWQTIIHSGNTSLITTTGTITSGTWSGSFGAVSGANLTALTAGNLAGTISSTVLGNSSFFLGTTGIALNRASAAAHNIAGLGTISASGVVSFTNTTATINATSGALVVSGGIGCVAVYASGDVTAFSDARIKTDVEVISHALDKVCQIRGVTYTRTDNGDLERGKRSTGVIAQEVEAVLPEAVVRDALDPENGTMGVNYGNLAGLLIEAIKELRQENLELKARLAMLEAKEI